MKNYDLSQEAYGWYVVSDRQEDLKETAKWYMVVDKHPMEIFEKMTHYEKALNFIDIKEAASLFVRKATYKDVYDALVDSPGWNRGDTIAMLYEIADFIRLEQEFIDECDYEKLYNNILEILN